MGKCVCPKCFVSVSQRPPTPSFFLSYEESLVLVDEYIRLGTVETRLNSKLREGHTVPYPACLEIKYSAETFSELRTKSTEVVIEDEDQIGGQDRQQVLLAMDLPVAAGDGAEKCQVKSSASEVSMEERQEMLAQAQTIIKNVAKCHSQWDKAKREWQMRLAASRGCERTRGSVVDKELAKAIADGTSVDTNLMALEAQMKAAGEVMDLGQMAQAKAWCEELFKHRKVGQSRSGMLLSWIDAE